MRGERPCVYYFASHVFAARGNGFEAVLLNYESISMQTCHSFRFYLNHLDFFHEIK